MVTTVYHTHTRNLFIDALWEDPIPLIKDIQEDFRGFETYQRVMKCPSFRDHVKNTYVIKSPIEFKIEWNEQSRIVSDKAGVFSDTLYPHVEILTGDQAIFFAESSVQIEVLPAFLHKDMPRLPFLSGSYDIGKWCRPVHPTFLFERGETLHIKENQPLMYVRFDQKVKLKRFRYTEAFDTEMQGIIQTRDLKSHGRLEGFYDFFQRTRRRKFLINEIKNNLL